MTEKRENICLFSKFSAYQDTEDTAYQDTEDTEAVKVVNS